MNRNVLFLVACVVLLGTAAGCYKKQDTIAKIYVRNSSNELVAGANVRLDAEPTQGAEPSGPVEFEMTSTTNSSGVAVFNFNDIFKAGQAGVVVADIEAIKDGQKATGIIKVVQEETSEETVFM